MVNTVRHRRSLFLASSQADKNVDGSWTFRFEDPITHDKDIRETQDTQPRVGVLNAHIPMSFYVITSSTNTLRLFRDPDEFYITIPPGNYTATSIAGVLNSLTSAVMGDISNGLIVWEFYPVTLKLVATVERTELVDTRDYAFGGGLTTAGPWLGLDNNQEVAIPNPIEEATTPSALDLAGPRFIFVDVDLPVESSDSSARSRGVLSAIPVGAPAGALQYWQPSTVQFHRTSFDALRSLNIKLTDEKHISLDLNGVDWAMEIEFA